MVNLHLQKEYRNSTLTKGNFCPTNGEYLILLLTPFSNAILSSVSPRNLDSTIRWRKSLDKGAGIRKF